MTNVFCHVIKISKNYQSKLIKMEEENDFENFEDNSIDPFDSSESDIDDSDSETEFPADRMVAVLHCLEILNVLIIQNQIIENFC